MDILKQVRDGLAMIAQGREAVEQAVASLRESREALATEDRRELERMLERERAETEVAHKSLDDAIQQQLKR